MANLSSVQGIVTFNISAAITPCTEERSIAGQQHKIFTGVIFKQGMETNVVISLIHGVTDMNKGGI